MDETLIKNHNERVKPEDTVFFLGDFCFRNSAGGKSGEGVPRKYTDYLSRLNGHYIFVQGNHDSSNGLKAPIQKLVLEYGGFRINCTHKPEHADPSYTINLVGHVHSAWRVKRLSAESIMFNVGVDVNNYRPVNWNEINKVIAEFIRNEKRT
jgi:calcineurin-like phosphoesterase family protein